MIRKMIQSVKAFSDQQRKLQEVFGLISTSIRKDKQRVIGIALRLLHNRLSAGESLSEIEAALSVKYREDAATP